MALTQQTRMLQLATSLGEDVLLLTAFSGYEEISRLFSFRLDMISDDNKIAAKDIVGSNLTFSIKLSDDEPRFFNGFVSQFLAGDEDDNKRRDYRVEVVPWLWCLTQTADCRIFQNKTVPEIIKQVFDDAGFTDYELTSVKGSHKRWEYCVQYRETDFNFVSRLMEQEGLFYYFRHEDGKHVLVIADNVGGYSQCQEKEVDFPRDFGGQAVQAHLTSWERRYGYHSGKWTQTDYNFEQPSTSLMSQAKTLTNLPGIAKFEVYDYPGEYSDKSAGDAETRLRMEEEETEHDVVEGASICRTFTPGARFKVRQHRSDSEKGKSFVITSVQHTGAEPLAYETGAAAGDAYRNAFTCIPESVVFRPARTTPKPIVHGVQTAVVVGPPGDEIFCDKYGRVKVQFHWDREGKNDENSSCWIRVSQVHAGPSFGGIDIPRIGEEVIVDFLEGDPDRPIITGRVYHAENMPPFGLPDSKNISGLKSNSTKGGGGYNEYILDDTKGKELIREHGQFDKDSTIEHDLREHVLHDRSRDVTNDETVSIGHDQALTVDHDQTIVVKHDRTQQVSGSESYWVKGDRLETVEGNRHLTVQTDQIEKCESNKHVEVTGDQSEKVGGTLSLEAGKLQIKVLGNDAIDAAQEVHIKAGTKLILEATAEITIVQGGNFIKLGADGITIFGAPMTKINSGGAPGQGSGSKPKKPKAPKKAKAGQ